MYTGIVTATFPIAELERRESAATFGFDFDERHLEGLQIGASVSLDGACMTVVSINGSRVLFDASIETLRLTTLGQRKTGDRMNIERSAKSGVEVGGHGMSGHVDGMLTVTAVERTETNCILSAQIPAAFRRYIFNKGYIGMNGCSLTISDLDRERGTFNVYLIPETLRQTTFGRTEPGDDVNFEVDRQTQIMVDTIHDAVRETLREMKLS